MRFDLVIQCDNAAFEDDPGAEIARVLREVAGQVEGGTTSGAERDYNGNTVCTFTLLGREQ